MECYEGATMIKTFRGLLADDTQDTIVLHTNDGSTGYKIVKFELFPAKPGAASQESVVKIYKVAQTVNDGIVDFSDNTMLAAGYLLNHLTATDNPAYMDVVFDKEIFNQDIYVTHNDVKGSESVNYYIELEQVKLDLNSNTVATLKDMRNTATPLP